MVNKLSSPWNLVISCSDLETPLEVCHFFGGGSKLTSTQKGHVPWRGTIFKRKLHLPTIHFQGILLVSGSIIWKGLEGKNNLKHLPTCPAIPSWFCHDFELLCFREMEALMTFGVSYCWLVFFFTDCWVSLPPIFFDAFVVSTGGDFQLRCLVMFFLSV